jgi:phytoene/squalene synthetase
MGMSESDPDCPYVTGTVTKYCTLTPLTLTDAEREAIVTALAFLREEADEPGVAQDADTLRGLLERTRGTA